MNTYTIKEISEKTGLTHSTLRYYEDIGLLTNVIHKNNKRIYTDDHIRRIDGILCFKNTSLPINSILEFFKQEENPQENIESMITLLENHQKNTIEQIRSMEYNLKQIDRKVIHYNKIKEAMIKNLPWPNWDSTF